MPPDRLKDVSDPQEIEGWLGFHFPSRNNKYSSLKYHWYHFSGTDYNASSQKKAIYKIIGDNKEWAKDVDSENANYDYLMFADVDFAHPEVQEDVKKWGVWIGTELKLKGFRFDAIKHFSEQFLLEFIRHLDETVGEGWFMVGEFWKTSLPDMTTYLEKMQHKFSLFDAPLVYNFSRISQGDKADLRQVFDETLVQVEPYNAVVSTVANHVARPFPLHLTVSPPQHTSTNNLTPTPDPSNEPRHPTLPSPRSPHLSLVHHPRLLANPPPPIRLPLHLLRRRLRPPRRRSGQPAPALRARQNPRFVPRPEIVRVWRAE